MGLKICEDCRIGSPGIAKGISGGEKKRLAFAAEVWSLLCYKHRKKKFVNHLMKVLLCTHAHTHTHTFAIFFLPISPILVTDQSVHFVLRRADVWLGFFHGTLCRPDSKEPSHGRPHGHSHDTPAVISSLCHVWRVSNPRIIIPLV